MHPIMQSVWDLASKNPDWDPSTRVRAARALWNEHRYKSIWCGWVMTCMTAQEAAGGTEERPIALQPHDPPDPVLDVLGNKHRALTAAYATWDACAAIFTSEFYGVDDPMLADQLKALSSNLKGTGVYMFGWWTHDLLRMMVERDPSAFEVKIDRIEADLDQAGKT